MQADERMLLACLALVLCIPAVHYENKVKCAFLSWAEATFVSTSLCAVAVASHKHPRLWLECLPHADLYPAWMPAGVSCSGLPVSMARQESTDSWTLHSEGRSQVPVFGACASGNLSKPSLWLCSASCGFSRLSCKLSMPNLRKPSSTGASKPCSTALCSSPSVFLIMAKTLRGIQQPQDSRLAKAVHPPTPCADSKPDWKAAFCQLVLQKFKHVHR